MPEDISITSVIGYLVGVAGALIVIFSRVKNSNLADLKDRVAILEAERTELRGLLEGERETANAQHLANQKAIASLETEVKQYRDLKLQSIAEHLQKIDESNNEILDTLRGSAKAAEVAQADGGLLVKTKGSNPLDVKPVE